MDRKQGYRLIELFFLFLNTVDHQKEPGFIRKDMNFIVPCQPYYDHDIEYAPGVSWIAGQEIEKYAELSFDLLELIHTVHSEDQTFQHRVDNNPGYLPEDTSPLRGHCNEMLNHAQPVLDLLEFDYGAHVLIHTLAANDDLRFRYESVTNNWKDFINDPRIQQTPADIDKEKWYEKHIPWISIEHWFFGEKTTLPNGRKIQGSRLYINTYESLYSVLPERKKSQIEKLELITETTKKAYHAQVSFNQAYHEAIKSLSEQTTFDGVTPWGLEPNPNIEEMLEEWIAKVNNSQNKTSQKIDWFSLAYNRSLIREGPESTYYMNCKGLIEFWDKLSELCCYYETPLPSPKDIQRRVYKIEQSGELKPYNLKTIRNAKAKVK